MHVNLEMNVLMLTATMNLTTDVFNSTKITKPRCVNNGMRPHLAIAPMEINANLSMRNYSCQIALRIFHFIHKLQPMIILNHSHLPRNLNYHLKLTKVQLNFQRHPQMQIKLLRSILQQVVLVF